MTSLSPIAAADLDLLCTLGRNLHRRPAPLAGRSVREFLISALLKVRDKRGRLCALVPNAVQLAFERAATHRNIVLKARQMGLTTWIAARSFISTITCPGTVTVQVAHDQRSAEEIFRIVHRFLEHLPPCLTGEDTVLVTSRANVRQIVFPHLDSEYRVESAADPNAGRGLTIHNLHCSEVARWPGCGEEQLARLAGLRAAVPPDGEIVLESTPNGAGGLFYEEWCRAPETGFQQHFFPWFLEPGYAVALQPEAAQPAGALSDLTAEERALMSHHALTLAQVLFRRDVRANFRRLAAQEFAEDPESCFLASGECVFDQAIIDARLRALPAPAESRDNGRLLIFWPPKSDCHPERAPVLRERGTSASDGAPRREAERLSVPRELPYSSARGHYILAVDPAGGGSEGDYACAQVIDAHTGLQCAELHGHYPPRELASRVAALAREYGNALVAIERNNHGHAVLAYLTSLERYENIYERGGQLGWLTSAVTRPEMLERFAATLTTHPELFSSQRLLHECRTFVRRSDGSPAAAAGCHDDCILALAIALTVRAELAPVSPAPAPQGFSLQI